MGHGFATCFPAPAHCGSVFGDLGRMVAPLGTKRRGALSAVLGPIRTRVLHDARVGEDFEESYGILTHNDDDEAELLFSPHWSGVYGICPGSDCGDQPQEAFHSPWKKQLDVLGKSADCTTVLSTMQELYQTWEKQCDWKGDKPLQFFPPAVDENFIGGNLMARLGRNTAFELWEGRARNHIVVDVTDMLQVVAMVRTANETLCQEDAQAAVRMLSLGGDALQTELVRVGILTDMKASSGVVVRRCTSLEKVLRFFKNMCFVLVRPAHHPPFPTFAGPLCSCTCFCRYAGCEHVEFAKMLDLRLRPATSSAEQLPVQRQRGRKRGQTLTARGDAKAKRDTSAGDSQRDRQRGGRRSPMRLSSVGVHAHFQMSESTVTYWSRLQRLIRRLMLHHAVTSFCERTLEHVYATCVVASSACKRLQRPMWWLVFEISFIRRYIFCTRLHDEHIYPLFPAQSLLTQVRRR